MLIIIEGIDCSGKSTLADELFEELVKTQGVALLHRGVPVAHVLEEYSLPFADYVPGAGISIICDRWHIGPDVYGPIKRNDGGLDPVIRWHMESFLLAKGAFIVHTEMPLPQLVERMNSRGEDYLEPHEVESVFNTYRDVIKKSRVPYLTSASGFHDIEPIIQSATLYENASVQISPFLSYVGPRRPNSLYIGTSDTPIAYLPYENTEAYNIVKKYGLDNLLVASFANSNEKLDRLWDATYNPTTFALDEEAADRCTDAKIPFTHIKEKTWND